MRPNKVREYREGRGMTQAELSRRSRIAQANLSRIENGHIRPWPKARRALSRVLKVSQRELFPGQE